MEGVYNGYRYEIYKQDNNYFGPGKMYLVNIRTIERTERGAILSGESLAEFSIVARDMSHAAYQAKLIIKKKSRYLKGIWHG